jgi:hypothetical protein
VSSSDSFLPVLYGLVQLATFIMKVTIHWKLVMLKKIKFDSLRVQPHSKQVAWRLDGIRPLGSTAILNKNRNIT